VGLIERWRRFVGADERSGYPLSFDQWLADVMAYGGSFYPVSTSGTLGAEVDRVGAGFEAYVAGAYKSSGVVFACELARMMLFSEARFQWRALSRGRPGRLFGTPELGILENPWPGGTTGDLLTRMILDADLAGNAFVRKVGRDRLERLRPDWVWIVYEGDPWEPTTDVVAYAYDPGGTSPGSPVVIPAEEVAHFAPVPDPLSPRKGMSWLTPVLREIDADAAATAHKGAVFSKGGTPNMIVRADATVTKELFDAVVSSYRKGHEDPSNAGKAWFVQAGFDPTVVGANLQQLDFKATQGAGETRIAAASGIHPVIVGLSEGLAGSALNAGNFNAARRLTADKTLRPLWRNASGSLEWLVSTPAVAGGRAELWYDDRDIPFVQQDEQDAAKVLLVKAQTIEALIRAGYNPAIVADAVEAGDLTGLQHTGLVSVQLQEPGLEASPNGKVEEEPVAVAPVE
jgi:hypothetical protein